MKKLLLLPVMLTFIVLAAPVQGADKMPGDIDRMIRQNYFLNPSNWLEMRTESLKQSYEYRVISYMNYEQNGLSVFLWNMVLPSLGSFLQGDTTGGWIILGGFGGGFVLTLPYFFITLSGYRALDFVVIMEYIGQIAMIGAYTLGLVFPWTYSVYYNNNLRNSLGLLSYRKDHFNEGLFASSRNGDQLLQMELFRLKF